jgi:hypothetical protein
MPALTITTVVLLFALTITASVSMSAMYRTAGGVLVAMRYLRKLLKVLLCRYVSS